MSIGRRLTIAFATVVLIIAIGAGITSWQFASILAQTRRLTALDDAVVAVYRVRADVGAIRRRLDDVSRAQTFTRFNVRANALRRDLFADIDDALKYFRETNTPIPGTLGALRDAVGDQMDAMQRLAKVGDWTAVQLRLDTQLDAILDSVREMVERVDMDVSQQRVRFVNQIEADEKKAQFILVLTAVISLIVSLLLGWYVTRSIVLPLSQLKTTAHQLAQGDFNIGSGQEGSDELGEVRKAFATAAQKLAMYYAALKRSNEDLEQFAYAASHDLQEPLRTISLFSEILSLRFSDALSEQGKEYLAHLVEAAKRMRELVAGILEYSRLAKSEDEKIESVDTAEVVATVIKNLQATIDDSHARITYDSLPVVSGHKAQLVQLFQNLIGNAIKYRRDDTPLVHISARRDKGMWRFCVEDNGIGIEPKYYVQIFGMFKQLNRGGRGGVGMGLAISKRIVERQGGSFFVTSKVGKGSQFYFTLREADGVGHHS